MAYRKYNNYSAAEKKSDSKWEDKLRAGVLKGIPFHSAKILYTIDHKYQPDFAPRHGRILIEAKGRFRERSEASKYIWVREALETCPHCDLKVHAIEHEDHLVCGACEKDFQVTELVFLFMKPEQPMPHAKTRRDGTKRTHAEWAEKNGFRWFTEQTIHEVL